MWDLTHPLMSQFSKTFTTALLVCPTCHQVREGACKRWLEVCPLPWLLSLIEAAWWCQRAQSCALQASTAGADWTPFPAPLQLELPVPQCIGSGCLVQIFGFPGRIIEGLKKRRNTGRLRIQVTRSNRQLLPGNCWHKLCGILPLSVCLTLISVQD